jgi:aryl-alcohol dehydrogenase-like predicted oxidoreductase
MIIGAASLGQLEENIDVVEVELPEPVLREICAIHQRYPNPAL